MVRDGASAPPHHEGRHPITICVFGPSRLSNRSIAASVIDTHATVGEEIVACQMQEYCAAAAGDAKAGTILSI
jgi:hypothetical protein